MASISITWHAVNDGRTCPICRTLDGYEWTFDTGKDLMTDSLVHPSYGTVWNLSQGSNAHGNHRFNCRCHISEDIDLEDVLAKCVYLRELAYTSSEAYIPWRGGDYLAGGIE